MFDNQQPQSHMLNQIELMRSLNSKLSQTMEEKIASKQEKSVPTRLLHGVGDMSDNLNMIRNYVCSCGKSVRTLEHTTTTSANAAFDNYLVNCGNCGKEEKVTFQMMRSALKSESKSFIRYKRSVNNPYI